MTAAGTPTPTQPTGNPRAAPPPNLRAAAGTGGAPTATAVAPPVSVSIPAVDIRSRLIRLGLTKDRELEVPTDYGLAGWFTGGPRPGEKGPAVIAGHVDSRTGPAVFYRLRDLRPGDRIVVQRQDGTAATFAVTAVAQYPKDSFPTSDVYGPVPQPELRLITCGGSFDRQQSSYRANLVVSATLTAS